MTLNKWIIGVWFMGLLWVLATNFSGGQSCSCKSSNADTTPPSFNTEEKCSDKEAFFKVDDNSSLFVADNLTRAINNGTHSIIFLRDSCSLKGGLQKKWPEIDLRNKSVLLHMTKWHTKKSLKIYVLFGENCNAAVNETKDSINCTFQHKDKGVCQMRCLETNMVCTGGTYDASICNKHRSQVDDKYFVDVTATTQTCINCNNPVKAPEKNMDLSKTVSLTRPVPQKPEEPLQPAIAVEVMDSMDQLASSLNESTVALSLGESIAGVLMRVTDLLDIDEVSFAYTSPNDSFNILDDRKAVSQFSRSVTVSKEAFEKAVSLNVTVPFVAVFRFLNMSKDVYNHSVLGDEVIAIEMGASIKNLTDTININFWNMTYKGIPSCYSWKGEGSRPNWTDDGCETVTTGRDITCRCSHMTFFAILLTPLNETISTSDLNTLTTITRVGCGLSMFFLGIVLFMHFVLRRARSSKSTLILIHLVSAMFLLDFTFLINDFVAKTKNSIGCMIMAALMHYFMLTTFTWFAVHAFHLCLQLYTGGKIEINHYVLRVSITSWVLPSIIGIVLLSIGKYGEVAINTENVENVMMCWIKDNDVHYIVNIGYYALVFLFTFSTLILMVTWLYCHKRAKAAGIGKDGRSGQSICTIMGLCCILGVTWGCAFFAYGVFRVPAYYIFTVLNSFQGFCLFIYYYKTSHTGEAKSSQSTTSQSTSSTLKTNLDEIFNPYQNIKQ